MRQTQSSSNTTTNIGLIVAAVVFWLVGSFYVYQNGIEWFMPDVQASAEAESIDELFRFMLGIATFIFLMVETLVFGFAIRYGFLRDRNDTTDGPPIHGNAALELIWTLIPSIIVFVLTIYSFQVLIDTTEAREDEHIVTVTGQRFFWQFQYPDEEYDLTSNHILVVPEGENVRLEMHSEDVIHAFWVPAFRVKQDVMPGRVTELRFTPTEITGLPPDFELVTLADLEVPTEETACPTVEEDAALDQAAEAVEGETEDAEESEGVEDADNEGLQEGEVEEVVVVSGEDGEVPPVNYPEGYDLVCAELCGGSHGLMRGEVFVVTREDYDAYIESLKARIIANQAQTQFAIRCGGEQIAEVGRVLFAQYGCNTCHALADVGSTAVTGPNLSNVGVRADTIPGYDSDTDYIHTSIVNPNAYIAEGFPPNIMPQNFVDRIPPEELDLLVAYLTLQEQ